MSRLVGSETNTSKVAVPVPLAIVTAAKARPASVEDVPAETAANAEPAPALVRLIDAVLRPCERIAAEGTYTVTFAGTFAKFTLTRVPEGVVLVEIGATVCEASFPGKDAPAAPAVLNAEEKFSLTVTTVASALPKDGL